MALLLIAATLLFAVILLVLAVVSRKPDFVTEIAPHPHPKKTIWLETHGETRIARNVHDSWRAFNPDWNVVCLNEDSLGAHVDFSSGSLLRRLREEPGHAFSDMLRLTILSTHGGVWADGTTLCMEPLDDWLYDKLLPCGFWMYHGTDRGEGPAIFFIASTKHSYLLNTWRGTCEEYWTRRIASGQPSRHWLEETFSRLCLTDATFREQWSSVPYLWCEAFGQPNMLLSNQPSIDQETLRLLEYSPPHVLNLPPGSRGDAVTAALDACILRQNRLPNAASAAALSPSRHVTLPSPTEALRRELPPNLGNLLVISDCGCRTSLEKILHLCRGFAVTPLVYDKCSFCAEVPDGTYCRPLRNVGRDFGTLFWFLCRYYAVIPDETVLFFSAGNMLKHDRERRLARLLAGKTVAATQVGEAETFTLREYEGNPLRASDSENLRAWYEKFVGTWDPTQPGSCWNGLLRISGAELRKRPLSLLINVATTLTLADGLEAVHHVERCVHSILFS